MTTLSGFNANDVPAPIYGAMPPGLYAVMATASERKLTKMGDGEYLQFTIDVLDEAYNNKKLWARLNLWNKSETAVQIAQRELGAICRAVNVLTPEDSAELLNIPFVVRLSVEKDKSTGKEQNKIDGYFSVAEANELAQQPAAAPAAAKPAAAASAPARSGPVWPGAPR